VENEETQNIGEELGDRLPKRVTAEKVRKGDKVHDEDWIKLVDKVTIRGNEVQLHFASNPYEAVAPYRFGQKVLVYRLIGEMGDDV
jgi:hypothetical protein